MSIRRDHFNDRTDCGPEVALSLWTDPSSYVVRSGWRPGYYQVSIIGEWLTRNFEYTPSSRSRFRKWLEKTFDVVSSDLVGNPARYEPHVNNGMNLHFRETGARYPEPAPETRALNPRRVQEILSGRRELDNSGDKLEPGVVEDDLRVSSSESEQTESWTVTDVTDLLSEHASNDNFSIISIEDVNIVQNTL